MFLALVLTVISFFVPWFGFESPDASLTVAVVNYQSEGAVDNHDNLLLDLLGMFGPVLAVTLTGVAIGMYKKRKSQNLLLALSVAGLLTGLAALYADYLFSGGAAHSFGIKLGAVCALLSVFLLILAMRGVQKDEQLVRSMDRLR